MLIHVANKFKCIGKKLNMYFIEAAVRLPLRYTLAE
jgi:hypothetical protein